MKKSLIFVLMLLFMFSITCVASAAAFSDVPRDHWAYKAINNLAKDGIVQGDGDGTFRGDRTMTRYEMAMIVANALTKEDKVNAEQKALIDKLAKEFSSELASIDNRLKKVEDKQRLTVTPVAQFYFANTSLTPNTYGTLSGGFAEKTMAGERIRIFLNSADSENKLVWNALFSQLKSNLQTNSDSNGTFERFNVTVKDFAGGSLKLGKDYLYLGKGAFVGFTNNVDGAIYSFKSGVTTLKVGAGNLNALGGLAKGEFEFFQADCMPDKSHNLGAFYFQDQSIKAKITGVFGLTDIGNGMGFIFEAARNTYKGTNVSGYILGFQGRANAADLIPSNAFFLANPKVKGDSGWGLTYRHMPTGVSGNINLGSVTSFTPILTDTAGGVPNCFNNINAITLDYVFVPTKNVLVAFQYNNIKPIGSPSWTNNFITSAVNFYF